MFTQVRLWHKCVSVGKLFEEKKAAVKDAEQRLSAEARARRVAEAEARRAAELRGQDYQVGGDDGSSSPPPVPRGRGETPSSSDRTGGRGGGMRGSRLGLEDDRLGTGPGRPRVNNAERCGTLASALWRVARRRVAGALVALHLHLELHGPARPPAGSPVMAPPAVLRPRPMPTAPLARKNRFPIFPGYQEIERLTFLVFP